MVSIPHGNPNWPVLLKGGERSLLGITPPPFLQLGGARARPLYGFIKGRVSITRPKKMNLTSPRCSSSPNSSDSEDGDSNKPKASFGNTRKDVILIGVGVTLLGIGLKSGLEYAGVDPLLAGNAVQLIIVLGLTLGWISTYIFRVSNKEMTYAQQLRDYENKVMQKRLESLSEAEIEALLEQVEEEKRQVTNGTKQL